MSLRKFLENQGPDFSGRKLSDIWQFTYDEMESCHDYIQWVFPLDQESGSVPHAPILKVGDIEEIRNSPVALSNLRQSADWFYQFLCRNDQWLCMTNHNHLRITRLIKSLRTLAGDDTANAIREKIIQFAKKSGITINVLTLEFWANS